MDRRANFPQAFNQTDDQRTAREASMTNAVSDILRKSPTITTIQLLKELHKLRCVDTIQSHPENDRLADQELIYVFMGNNSFPKGTTRKIVAEIEDQLTQFQYQTIRYDGNTYPRLQAFNPYIPGEYRKIATLVPLGKNYRNTAPFDVYSQTFHTMIDTSSTTGEILQFPNPVLKVDENMDRLAHDYEKEKDSALRRGSYQGFSRALSKFYLMALGIIHPFSDGNGGSLRTLVKAEVQKVGKVLDLSAGESSRRDFPFVTAPFGFSMAFSQDTGIPFDPEGTFYSLFKDPGDTRRFYDLYQQVIEKSFTHQFPLTEHMINSFATYLERRIH